jgi:plastocyanin
MIIIKNGGFDMKVNKVILVCLMMATLLVVFAGCATASDVSSSNIPPEQTVELIENDYVPAELTIKKGQTVLWINKDLDRHDVVSATFNSPLMGKGDTFEYTFNEVGTFDYACTPHPWQVGKIIVTE